MSRKDTTMKFDFSDVQGDFTAIPAGTYETSLFSCKQKNSQAGNPMLEWAFTVEAGEYEGRRVFTNTPLLPQTMWRLKNMLRGFEDVGELEGEIEFEPEDLIGQVVLCKVTQRTTPDGTVRNDVSGTVAAE